LSADNDDELEIAVNVYVNARGRIIGRTLEYNNGGYDDCTVTMLLPENNGEFGCELSYIDESTYNGGRSRQLVGKGTRKGYNVNGDFTVKYQELQSENDYEIANISVDDLSLKDLLQGYVNATFELTPCDDLSEINSDLSYIEDFKLTLTTAMDKDTMDCSIGFNYGIDDLGTLTISTKTGSDSIDTAMIPVSTNTVMASNDYELIDWLSGISLTQLINNLKAVGIPQDWLAMLSYINLFIENGGLYSLIPMM
jgi:hypothetical protein